MQGLGPVQIEDYIVLILEVKVTSQWTTQAQKGSWEVRKAQGVAS